MRSKVLSPSGSNSQSYEFFWRIENFKDWHKNVAKSISSPLMFSPTGSSSTKFQMKLYSRGLNKDLGRVNLSLYFECFTKKLFKLVPIEVKVSVIDENDIKRYTQEFLLAANGLPLRTKIGRYYYRTDDSKKAEKQSPFYLIIDNVATFHFEMRILTKEEFNEKLEVSEAKFVEMKKAKATAKNDHSLFPKIWSAIRSMVKI